jgi:hypothetical protein
MATEQGYILNQGSVTGARFNCTQTGAMAVNGNTTVTGQLQIPTGCLLRNVYIETPTAISGTPTHCYVRVGITLAGQEIVADVDAQAQGHIGATLAATFDKIAGLAAISVIYYQVVTTGGTGSAGTINLMFDYCPAAR